MTTKFKALLIPLLAIANLLCVSVRSYADTVDIKEWLVPWSKTDPTDTYVDDRGRVWFVGRGGDYVGTFHRESAEFFRYDLRRGTTPQALIMDRDRKIWFVSNRRHHIGTLDPGTGQVTEFAMPDGKAKEPNSMVIDQWGDVWFTLERGNFVGRLRKVSKEIQLASIPTKKSRPFGITIDVNDEPWVAASGRNALIHVNPVDMSVTEFATPDEDSRLRRIVTTSDGLVWYTDYELGRLGRFDPQTAAFSEWSMPGGVGSKPFGMAVDRDDRLWVIETGDTPNRLVGFDSARKTFLTETVIPSGAGNVSNLHYHESSGEIWFGTKTNYIGRAKIH